MGKKLQDLPIQWKHGVERRRIHKRSMERGEMKVGSLVGWKSRFQMDLPSDLGVIISRLRLEHDPWPYWKVLFPDRGVLHCRESDLQEME